MSAIEEIIQRLRRSEYFDADWYVSNYPDVERLGMDPAEHYARIGADLGRAPGPDFSARVTAKGDSGRADPLVRFIRMARKTARARIGADDGAAMRRPLPRVPRAPGPYPPPPDPVPHYGVAFHELLKAARANMKPRGKDMVYDTLRDEFDLAYYLMRNRGLAEARSIDPLHHYIHHGAAEGRDPTPYFNTKYYKRKYPDVAKSGHNPFYHYVRWGRAEGRAPNPHATGDLSFRTFCERHDQDPEALQAYLADSYADLRHRLEFGELGEMVVKAAALEPLISHAWPLALEVQRPPFNRVNRVPAINAIMACQKALDHRRAKAVIAVNKPRWGSSKRMEGYLAAALSELHGPDEVVIVYTDASGTHDPERFPAGVRAVDLAGLAARCSRDDRDRVFLELVRSLQPDAAFIINSAMFWRVVQPFGKALAASVPIYAGMFCGEQTAQGFWEGYPYRNFYRHFDVLSGIYTDSKALADELAERFVLPPSQREKLTVLPAPVDKTIPLAKVPYPKAGRRPQVFWSGRFDRQKRVDLVYAIARHMPDVDFRLWGEPVLDKSITALTKPKNVRHEGVYQRFRDLPLHEADAWLYTSEWDGVPSILLEIGMTGVPLVGSRVGGTGEVLSEGLAWPVDAFADLTAYEAALRYVLNDPDAARAKGLKLRQHLLATRTTDNYRDLIQRTMARGVAE